MTIRRSSRCIVPPDLLARIAREGDAQAREAALATLQLDMSFRLGRAEAVGRVGGPTVRPVTFARVGGQPQRTIYDQANQEMQTPGTVVRTEGQAAVDDVAVNEAYDGFGATYRFYWDVFQRDSIDGQGLPLFGGVHYGQRYDNAFYDGAVTCSSGTGTTGCSPGRRPALM